MMMKKIPKEFETTPIVYVVRNTYQILVPVICETVMWVKVGDKCFYDDYNGVLRSDCSVHRMTVPSDLLDQEKQYTVYYRVISERKPYYTVSHNVLAFESNFRPIEKEPVHICHISDTHNHIQAPIAISNYFDENLDLLILNGDIPNHSGDNSYFSNIHKIASQLTNGEIPVVFARGNHDTRGKYAEKLGDYTPTEFGKTYYTFRVGHIWGIVLDCGEDKSDDHIEYGHTVCFEDFRRRQTEYIKEVIDHCQNEYEAEGVKNRLVIAHIPFTQKFEGQFDIEDETYTLWSKLLREHIRPQLMFCGHVHKAYITNIGDEKDYRGQPCPVIVSAQTRKTEDYYVGGAIKLYYDHCLVDFVENNNGVIYSENIKF